MKLRLVFVVAAILMGGAHTSALHAAEEGIVDALATWQSAGTLYRVGENEALFVGGFSGIMFVENGKGVLNAAKISCPGMVDVDLGDDSTNGEGRCVISGVKGDRIFAKWSCSGKALVGCMGKFELIAGTGRFQGITGGGDFVLRTAISVFARDMSKDKVDGIGMGLAGWPKLKYRIP